jgi:Predicted membrane protein (DUF2127)
VLRASERSRPAGIVLLSLFFALGTVPSLTSAAALTWPGRWADAVWSLRPEAKVDFARLGFVAIPLMCFVALACAAAAVGLWTRRRWGHRVAVGLLGINLVGDTLNALFRHDWRTLIGLPIGIAMLIYLCSASILAWFHSPPSRRRTNQ